MAEAVSVVHEIESEYREKIGPAREELRGRIKVARDEGILFAAIGRAAGVSRGRAPQLYVED